MTDRPLLSRRGRWVLVAVCVAAVLVAVAYVTAQASGPSGPPVAQGQVRLGPEPGEPVADYLAGLPATLPAPGSRVSALVQLSAEITAGQAAALAAGAPAAIGEAIFRVPIARVQTALRFVPLTGGGAPALTVAQAQALHAAEADAARQTGRPAAVAAAEAEAYRGAACTCVVALVVQADRAGLDALSAAPGVRAVQAAPAGSSPRELALAPLLPEQTEAATPLPDDGPVPRQ